MGVIENLLQTVPLPRMVEVSQRFDRPKLEKPASELGAAIRVGNYFSGLKPGAQSMNLSWREPCPSSFPPWAATLAPRQKAREKCWKALA